MGTCDLAFSALWLVTDPVFRLTLDTDQCGAESHRFCEFPVSGPDGANRLVTVTGIAVVGLDVDADRARGDIWIKTDYTLRPRDRYTVDVADDDVAGSEEKLRHTTYLALASIAEENEEDKLFQIDSCDAEIVSGGRVQIHIQVTMGMSTIYRIAYQSNFLIEKAELDPNSPIFGAPPRSRLESGGVLGG